VTTIHLASSTTHAKCKNAAHNTTAFYPGRPGCELVPEKNIHSFTPCLCWTISTMKDEKSAAKFHYIKTLNGKVVEQSTAFRVVSIYWQGVAPFPWYLNVHSFTWRLCGYCPLPLIAFLHLLWFTASFLFSWVQLSFSATPVPAIDSMDILHYLLRSDKKLIIAF